MRSMTGYGSGRHGVCAVEIQSVNRRQAEVKVNLPRELGSLEPAVREAVHARVARGMVVVNVALQARSAGEAPAPGLNGVAEGKALPLGLRRGR